MAIRRYAWRDGQRTFTSAQLAAGAELEALIAQHGGVEGDTTKLEKAIAAAGFKQDGIGLWFIERNGERPLAIPVPQALQAPPLGRGAHHLSL